MINLRWQNKHRKLMLVGGGMSLIVRDLENLQADYPDYRMELVDGKIVIMSPSGYESDEVAFRVGANWQKILVVTQK